MKKGQKSTKKHSFNNSCVTGDCDEWTADTTYFVQTNIKGE